MSRIEEQIGVKALLELASQSFDDNQIATARQFAQRALVSAEALANAEWEIVSRSMLMHCCCAMGDAEEAISHAAILLEFLYTPDSLRNVERQDHILELILLAFPTTVLSGLSSNLEEAIYGNPKLLERLFRVVNEGFQTLEQLGKNNSLQTLYFVRGQLEQYSHNYEAALQDHERALSLWERIPAGRQLEPGVIQVALAFDYECLGQSEEAQRRYKLVLEDGSNGPGARMFASYYLALAFLQEGKIKEAEVIAHQALQCTKELEIPPLSLITSITLFEIVLEAGRGASLISQAADLLKLTRRLPSMSVLQQVVYSQCGEIRLQQVFTESGLPASYDVIYDVVHDVISRLEPLLSSSSRARHIRLTTKAIRWCNRITMFSPAKELDLAVRVFTLLTKDSNSTRY